MAEVRYGQYKVPEVDEEVNFKVGQPSPSLLPLEKIRKAAAAKLEEKNPLFLQYGHLCGYPAFRVSLARFLSQEYGVAVDPEQLFTTTGVTGGLSLIMSICCKAGDLIFTEDPSYFLAFRIFQDYNLKVVTIAMDQDGLNMEALERALQEHGPPKFLYTIPIGQNPTGRTMSTAKRQRLIELAYQYNFKILADEVYQLLTFPGEDPPKPLLYFDDRKEKVIGLGSFSKILAPALRLGWIQASEENLRPLRDCGILDSSGGMNPFASGVVHQAIELGLQLEHLRFVQKELSERCQILMRTLDKYMPSSVTYEIPKGGYFVLVKLPDGMSSTDLLEVSVKNRVRFLPGTSFGEGFSNYIRLSFSYYSAEDIAVGIERLAQSIQQLAKA